MSVYLIATIEVRPTHFADFTQALGRIVRIVEANGWKLSSAFMHRTGPLNTVIDVWELPDFNAMDTGMKAIAADPGFAEIRAVLNEAIVKETLSFADKLVYPGLEGR